MNGRVVIVGSGASGVSAAEALLERGWSVTLVDVGRARTAPPHPEASFNGLKKDLDDPVSWFLGDDWGSLILPGHEGEYYGFPPSKRYVFDGADELRHSSRGFSPLVSFAAGGLAEAWTGGCYPFNEAELEAFPFGLDDLLPHYADVAARIGMSGAEDDLARFLPWHEGIDAPLDADDHTLRLLDSYARRRDELNRSGVHLGRSRLAVLSRDRADRTACSYRGRCLWGCPTDSLWTPSVTLAGLREHGSFDYVAGVHVTHFVTGSGGRVTTLHGRRGNSAFELACDRLVLAAGTLATTGIFLRSIRQDGDSRQSLEGLMDNRQVLMPFLNRSLLGHPWSDETYQYNQLAFGLEAGEPTHYVHGLVTTLKSALIHPIVQNLPGDLALSLRVFRNAHAALGLVNINFHDSRRGGNGIALEGDDLLVTYTPPEDEARRMAVARKRFRRALGRLGCFVPKAMTHVRPMGASVHYSGTLPMTSGTSSWTTTATCRSREFENLWIADGATFPFLPAKNLTFTLMANARRFVAHDFA